MKRNLLIGLMFLATAGFAAAQTYAPSTDVLGAHLNYGRGCPACHAPHSGTWGNGTASAKTDATTGNVALWGEDVSNLVGMTITSGGGSYTETLPNMAATTPDVGGMLTCLSCHDGNYAQGAMMKNKVYEPLPAKVYGTATIPTLLGNDNTTTGNYLNDHPVGLQAIWSCSGNWSSGCSISEVASPYNPAVMNIKVTMSGGQAGQFFTNYGFFVSLGDNGGPTNAVVLCTTCHNQHVMNVVTVKASNSGGTALSGMTPGTYQTMFFLRGPYNPWSPTSNEAAQFCRQCHGGESNEANGSTAGTTL